MNRWQRITQLFQQVVELPSEEREYFLRDACAEDLKLRRAVEALLEANGEAGDFLEDPVGRIPWEP